MPNSQPRVIRRARKKVNLYLIACTTKVARIKRKMARQSSLSLSETRLLGLLQHVLQESGFLIWVRVYQIIFVFCGFSFLLGLLMAKILDFGYRDTEFCCWRSWRKLILIRAFRVILPKVRFFLSQFCAQILHFWFYVIFIPFYLRGEKQLKHQPLPWFVRMVMPYNMIVIQTAQY